LSGVIFMTSAAVASGDLHRIEEPRRVSMAHRMGAGVPSKDPLDVLIGRVALHGEQAIVVANPIKIDVFLYDLNGFGVKFGIPVDLVSCQEIRFLFAIDGLCFLDLLALLEHAQSKESLFEIEIPLAKCQGFRDSKPPESMMAISALSCSRMGAVLSHSKNWSILSGCTIVMGL
jgi:hypothetical protein